MANNKPTNTTIQLDSPFNASDYDPLKSYRKTLLQEKYEGKKYSELTKKERAAYKQAIDDRKELIDSFLREKQLRESNLKTQQEAAKAEKEQYQLALKMNEAARANAKTDAERKAYDEERYNLSQMMYDAMKREMDISRTLLETEKETKKVHYENASVKEKLALKEEEHNKRIEDRKKAQLEIEEKIAKARLEGNEEDAKMWQGVLDKSKQRLAKESDMGSALKTDLTSLFKGGGLKEVGSNIVEGMTSGEGFKTSLADALKLGAPNIVSAFGPKFSMIVNAIKILGSLISKYQEQLDKGVEQAVKVQTSYLGKINSRLQGSGESFAKFQNDMGASFGKSAFISQQKLMETIAKMVDTGIAFNVEQRAIFQELKDSMVSTFDAFQGELPRLIRLQQTDVTASQMGFESLLTQFLNNQFQDTSYLSDVYDTISSALIDASSQLTAEGATEFNFAVQKWLGSLYSLGMSSEGVTKIAKGIEYLATGNVEALNSDDSLRTLFAAASGGAYSQILTGGLNATTVNELLASVVSYLRGISSDTNQVTKQALSGAFGGLSFSDLKALNNMTDNIIASIYETNKSYSDAMEETYNQLMYATTLYDYHDLTTNARVSPAQLFETAYENILYEYGIGIASDFGSYNTFRIASQLEDTGKIGKLAGKIIKVIQNIGADLSGDKTGGIETLFNMIDVEFSNADRYKNTFLNSGMMSSLISDLMGRMVISRGDAATAASLAEGNTLTGFSVMSRLNLSGVNPGAITDLSNTAAATASQTTTTGEAISRGVSDLYAELFERQSTAMKVSLNSIEGIALSALANIIDANSKSSVNVGSLSDSALKSLSEAMKVETLESIDDKLSGTIQVASDEDFVSSINSGLAYARGI